MNHAIIYYHAYMFVSTKSHSHLFCLKINLKEPIKLSKVKQSNEEKGN